ncbi:MAG: flagellar hook-length control protein FliK, partial [Eubacteriales bacterium]
TPAAIKEDRDLPLKQMLTKTLAAFYAPDEPKNANALKKTIEKLPLQLKELKVLLESNDTKSKESFLVKVNQAEKQIETLTEIKHINCFHVPIWLGNRPASTAELYVYQRKKNKTNSEQKGLTALLGIDTQNMGRVEVMVGLDRLSVDMDIGVERKDVLTAFEQNKDVLAATFEKQGYRMVGFKADMLEKRTTVLNVETRLAERSKMSNDRLDVRI